MHRIYEWNESTHNNELVNSYVRSHSQIRLPATYIAFVNFN